MANRGYKYKAKQYDRIIDDYIAKHLFDDILDTENEEIRNRYSVPEHEKYQDAGIQAAIMLQFEPFFNIIIKMGICIGFVIVMNDFCIEISGKRKLNHFKVADSKILYSFDTIYLLDVLLMLSYKKTSRQKVDYLHSSRHILIVIVEFASIIPFELLYTLNSYDSEVYSDIYAILRLRYCIRLIRLFVGIVQNLSATSLITDILAFASTTIFLVILCTNIHIIKKCWQKSDVEKFNCDNMTAKDILEKVYIVTGKLTGIVIDEDYSSMFLNDWYCTIAIAIFLIFILTLGRATFYFIRINVTSFQFTAFHEYVTNFLHKNRTKDDELMSQIDKMLPQTLQKYIAMLFVWHVRTSTVSTSRSAQIIPDIIHREITCDIYWDALKHVELFSGMPVDFLRYISTLVVHQFYTEGEPIYTRSENMTKLVFIINGIVKVHSEVNGETPIISFTNGTVLGASTLALSRNSTTYVTCHSFCETVELHRRALVKACKNYPIYVSAITGKVMQRCDRAREYLLMNQFQCDMNVVDENKELLSIRYIKHKLRVLLGKDIEKVNTQQIWSYDDQLILENQERSVFCSAYIRNYVITTDKELDPNINFMRRGLYFKFRPESPVLMVWNYMIVALALITSAVLPYNISFEQRITGAYTVFIITVTFIWFLDTVLQLVTGVVTADHTFNDFVSIFKYRMSSLCFVADIVACVPFEGLINILEGDVMVHVTLALQVNRILKLYRFSKLCNQGYWGSIQTQLYVKYVKYFILFAYWAYFLAAILNICIKFNYTNHGGEPTALQYLSGSVLISLQFLAGVDAHQSQVVDGIKSVGPLVCLQLCIVCARMYIISDIASAEALCEMRNSQYASFCASLKSNIKCFKLDKVSEKRLWANVKLQWCENKAEYILKKRPLRDLSTRLHELLNYSAFGHHLHNMHLLKDLPDNVIRDLCVKIDVRVVPCDEVVTYAGDTAREMYLILQGFCGRLNTNAKVEQNVLEPGSSISVLEMLHGFRSICTVIALTDCRLAVFERTKFFTNMTKYPTYLDTIMETLWCSVTRADLERIISIGTGMAKYKIEYKPRTDFYRYKYFSTYGSKDYYSYLYPFPRRLHFLRYFVLRMTICNHGTFLFYYEIMRCVFAYVTCVLGSFASLTNCTGMHFEWLFIILDATAWIDMVVRHYICYYDSRNLQERHPANTILYYWTHGFLIDLFGIIPFDLLINSNRRFHNEKPIVIYVWNRCLQLYRPFFFKRHIKQITNNSWLIACLMDFLQVLIITILVNQFVGRFKGLQYVITSDEFEGEMYKELHNLAVTASLFLNVGYKSVESIHHDYLIILLIFFGHIYIAVAMSKAIGISLFCNVDISTYQGKMTNLVNFLNYRRIDKQLKTEIIRHFEYIWLKRRGMVVHESVASLNTAFREDILYAVYGSAVQFSEVFPGGVAPKAFVQAYLLQVRHLTYLKRAIIYRVNDVHGEIHFLLKGRVNVIDPSKYIITTLHAGSFFGCLDRCALSRQTLTMAALGHCEILTINSLDFHKLLENFRDLRQAFWEKTSIHVDFIHGNVPNLKLKTNISVVTMLSGKSNRSGVGWGSNIKLSLNKCKLYTRMRAINSSKTFNTRWSTAIAVLTMVFFVVEIYQKVTLATDIGVLVTLYLSDLMTLYKIYTEFHLAVQDEYGHIITDRSYIAKSYRRASMGFYYDVFTVIPLEVFAIALTSNMATYLTILRSNRLCRILICFHRIHEQTMKLNMNVYWLRTTFGFLMLFTIQQFTIIFLVRNKYMEMEENMFRRYLAVNAASVEIICMLLVPSAIIEGNCWYKMFIVIKIAYLRICLLYFISVCTTALFMSHHNSFVYWGFTDRLVTFMKRLKISQPLLDRVVAYIKLFWTVQKGMQFPEFLDEAPYYLREAVLVSMFGAHIDQEPLLGRLHVDLVRQMVAQLRTRTFFTGDFITFVGDIDETMYFLHEGEVVSLSEDNLYEEVVLRTYAPGEMFGLRQGILKRCGHEHTFRATRYTIVLLLTRSRWCHLIDFFPASKRLIFDSLNVNDWM